jgi:hypothetical protein
VLALFRPRPCVISLHARSFSVCVHRHQRKKTMKRVKQTMETEARLALSLRLPLRPPTHHPTTTSESMVHCPLLGGHSSAITSEQATYPALW